MGIRLLGCFDFAYSAASLADRGWTNPDTTNITVQTSGGPVSGKKYVRFGPGLATASTTDFVGISKQLSSRIVGNTLRMAFWYRATSGFPYNATLTSSEALVRVDMYSTGTGGSPNISIVPNNSGFLTVYRMEVTTANTRTLAATGAINIVDGNWHHIELEIVVDPTAGSVKSWVDGVADINSTGIDTQDANPDFDLTYLAQVKLGTGDNASTAGNNVDIADFVLWDDDTTDATNKFSGALPSHTHNIAQTLPSTDDSVQFTRSTGSVNAANVDDPFSGANDGDTTYNSSTTSGHLDHLNFSYGFYADAVYSVQTVIEAKLDSAGVSRARVRGSAKNTSTLNSVDRFASFSTYKAFETVFAKDPNTGTDWTNATLATTKFGYGR